MKLNPAKIELSSLWWKDLWDVLWNRVHVKLASISFQSQCWILTMCICIYVYANVCAIYINILSEVRWCKWSTTILYLHQNTLPHAPKLAELSLVCFCSKSHTFGTYLPAKKKRLKWFVKKLHLVETWLFKNWV